MATLVSAPFAVLPHMLALVRQARRLFKALEHRRAVNDLAELSDAALKDIGLLRNDVDAALAAPFYEDPTMQLAALSGRRSVQPSIRSLGAKRPAPKKTPVAACVS